MASTHLLVDGAEARHVRGRDGHRAGRRRDSAAAPHHAVPRRQARQPNLLAAPQRWVRDQLRRGDQSPCLQRTVQVSGDGGVISITRGSYVA